MNGGGPKGQCKKKGGRNDYTELMWFISTQPRLVGKVNCQRLRRLHSLRYPWVYNIDDIANRNVLTAVSQMSNMALPPPHTERESSSHLPHAPTPCHTFPMSSPQMPRHSSSALCSNLRDILVQNPNTSWPSAIDQPLCVKNSACILATSVTPSFLN